MFDRGVKQLLSAVLVLAVQAAGLPALSAAPVGALTGTVHDETDLAPLAGARVFLGNARTGEVLPSEPTLEDGSFTIGSVPPATYEVAVETGAGLFLVRTPVALESGGSRSVAITVNPRKAPAAQPTASRRRVTPSVWSNPLTAALVVVGAALVVGVAVENATDDDDEPAASPFQ